MSNTLNPQEVALRKLDNHQLAAALDGPAILTALPHPDGDHLNPVRPTSTQARTEAARRLRWADVYARYQPASAAVPVYLLWEVTEDSHPLLNSLHAEFTHAVNAGKAHPYVADAFIVSPDLIPDDEPVLWADGSASSAVYVTARDVEA